MTGQMHFPVFRPLSLIAVVALSISQLACNRPSGDSEFRTVFIRGNIVDADRELLTEVLQRGNLSICVEARVAAVGRENPLENSFRTSMSTCRPMNDFSTETGEFAFKVPLQFYLNYRYDLQSAALKLCRSAGHCDADTEISRWDADRRSLSLLSRQLSDEYDPRRIPVMQGVSLSLTEERYFKAAE